MLSSMPLILAAISAYLLWDTSHSTLKWVIVGIAIFLFLSNQAVVNSAKMQATGESTNKITNIWAGVSLVTSIVVAIVSIYGIYLTL